MGTFFPSVLCGCFICSLEAVPLVCAACGPFAVTDAGYVNDLCHCVCDQATEAEAFLVTGQTSDKSCLQTISTHKLRHS